MSPNQIAAAIRSVLTPDLLKKEFRGGSHHLSGHCYVASEAFFHLLGGPASKYKSMFIRHEGSPHWWIKGPNGKIFDLTAEQFKSPVNYAQSRGLGFRTKGPSKRAVEVMKRVAQLGKN